MKLKIEINCDSKAFFEGCGIRSNAEILKILEKCIFDIKDIDPVYCTDTEFILSDIDGNPVGFYQFTEGD